MNSFVLDLDKFIVVMSPEPQLENKTQQVCASPHMRVANCPAGLGIEPVFQSTLVQNHLGARSKIDQSVGGPILLADHYDSKLHPAAGEIKVAANVVKLPLEEVVGMRCPTWLRRRADEQARGANVRIKIPVKFSNPGRSPANC